MLRTLSLTTLALLLTACASSPCIPPNRSNSATLEINLLNSFHLYTSHVSIHTTTPSFLSTLSRKEDDGEAHRHTYNCDPQMQEYEQKTIRVPAATLVRITYTSQTSHSTPARCTINMPLTPEPGATYVLTDKPVFEKTLPRQRTPHGWAMVSSARSP